MLPFVCFSDSSLYMRSFYHTTTSPLKSKDIIILLFEFSTAIFLYRHGNFRRVTPFSAAVMTIMSAHAQ